jgi:hypothetical protein
LLLTRFFDTISRFVPGDPLLGGNVEAIAKLNPDKIYVENVRSALSISTGMAERICETAVRQGLFDRYVEVMCPDNSVATSAPTEAELPPTVHYWQEENGELHDVELPTATLSKTVFYRYHK